MLSTSGLARVSALKPPPKFVPLRIYKDWVALNSKSSARHIMKPLTAVGRDECLALKGQIQGKVADGEFVVDAFKAVAAVESIDAESRENGGLIASRIRQGVIRDEALDRACFCAPLGRVSGPLQSAEGWHLVLVEERIGLERQDSGLTRVIAQPRADGEPGAVDSVVVPPDPEEVNELLDTTALLNLGILLVVTTVGGQILSDWAASIDIQAIAEAMD